MFRNNAELRREYLISIIVTLLLAGAGFLLDVKYAVFVLLTACLLLIIRLIADISRYRRIAELSDSIDKILHGAEDVKFEEYREGERRRDSADLSVSRR